MIQTRLVVGAGLLMAAFMVVIVVTYFSNNEAYYTVDELLANPDLYAAPGAEGVGVLAAAGDEGAALRRVQVLGDIDKTTVSRGADGLELRFDITGKFHRLSVVYRDVVPDTFDMASQVTVSGRVGPDGVFEADRLSVQCPAKYEAAPPGAEAAAPPVNG